MSPFRAIRIRARRGMYSSQFDFRTSGMPVAPTHERAAVDQRTDAQRRTSTTRQTDAEGRRLAVAAMDAEFAFDNEISGQTHLGQAYGLEAFTPFG